MNYAGSNTPVISIVGVARDCWRVIAIVPSVADSLCRALVCKKRELCLLRDAFTALCANKKDVLRKGSVSIFTHFHFHPLSQEDRAEFRDKKYPMSYLVV